jgi:hypothetical protein
MPVRRSRQPPSNAEQASKSPSRAQQVSKIAAMVVQDLFYPGTLGALLYSFSTLLDSIEIVKSKPLATFSLFMVLVYFTLDYTWTKIWIQTKPYMLVASLCDVAALIFILLTERVISPTSDHFSVANAALYFGIIHALYTVWCLVEKMHSHLAFKAIFCVLFFVNAFWYPHLEFFVTLQVLLCACYIYGIAMQINPMGAAMSGANPTAGSPTPPTR